jgi:hypothetical protein
MTTYYSIQRLIDAQLKQLGRSYGWLAHRLGYVNASKGIRRLQRLFSGDLISKTSTDIIQRLPDALIVCKSDVDQAVKETEARIEAERAAREAIWRANFLPDAFLKGSTNVPSSIIAFALSGGVERHLRIPLDLTKPPSTFLNQCLEYASTRPRIPLFGDTTGFIVNYTPDDVRSYDLNGKLIRALDFYYRPGEPRVYF